MNKQETAQVLAYLSAAFPHIRLTKETAIVYHDVLADLDFNAAMSAARELLKTEEFFPSASAIRRRVAQNAGVLAPSAQDAWAEVIGKARHEGRFATLQWTHPAIDAVVDSLGWYDICMSTNIDTVRAHFLRLYEDQRGSHDRTMLAEALPSLANGMEYRALGVGA